MARPKGPFRVEMSGSLTPELEGAQRSLPHPKRQGGKRAAPERREPHVRP